MAIKPLNNLSLLDNKPCKVGFGQLSIVPQNNLKTDTVVFRGNKLSPKYYKAKAYVDWVKRKCENEGKKLESIYQLDPERLDGIQEGIKVFENLDIKDLFLLEGTKTLLTQRGCSNNCSHCYICSRNLSLDNDKEHDNSNIAWEDFLDSADGVGEINKRLGFNLFNNYFENFLDSDPIATKMKDKKDKFHNYAEAVSEFYNRTNLSTGIITAGYDETNLWTKQAAEDLVKVGTSKPGIIDYLMFSVNPFHKILQAFNSNRNIPIKLAEQPDKTLNNLKTEEYKLAYEKFIDRVTKSIHTLAPLINSIKKKGPDFSFVSFLYAPESGPKSAGCDYNSVNTLRDDIYNKLKITNKADEEEYSLVTPQERSRLTQIENLGRATKFFDVVNDTPFIKFDNQKGKPTIVTEGIPKSNFYKSAIYRQLINTFVNNKDINDVFEKVLIKINPVDHPYIKKAKELEKANISENKELINHYKEKYIEEMVYTIKLTNPLLDIGKAEIVVNYSPESGFTYDQIKLLTDEVFSRIDQDSSIGIADLVSEGSPPPYMVPQKSLRHFIKFEELKEQSIPQAKKSTTKEEFIKIFNALPSTAKVGFLKDYSHKIINVDGQLLFEVDDTGPLEEQFVALKDLKFKFQNPKKHYKYDNFVFMDIDRNAIQAPETIKERDQEFDLSQQQNEKTNVSGISSFIPNLNVVA